MSGTVNIKLVQPPLSLQLHRFDSIPVLKILTLTLPVPNPRLSLEAWEATTRATIVTHPRLSLEAWEATTGATIVIPRENKAI